MKKLNKDDLKRRDEYVSDLEQKRSAIDDAVSAVNALIEDYNNVLEEARGWVEDQASAIESYMDDKSERWQEGDTGQAFSSWKEEFDNAELDGLEEVSFDSITAEGHASTLSNLPEAPEV